ncbi:MAG: undecaprenyl-diphosphate phosphatase [bacterium]
MNFYFTAALLGLVQGLTEFLPVSSSGHLVAVREIFQWPDQGALFDAILQLASVTALLIYFRKDVGAIIRSLNSRLATHATNQSRRLLWLLAISTVPVVGAGLLFPKLFEETARGLLPVAVMTIFVGLIFIVVERIAKGRKSLGKLTFFDALAIGVAQMASLLPGVSRSGSSIATGLYVGLKREESVHYAFLMGIPALLLAGGYALLQVEFGNLAIDWSILGISFAVAFFSSLVAIWFMMQWFKRHRLYVFAVYRIILGIGLIAWYLWHA